MGVAETTVPCALCLFSLCLVCVFVGLLLEIPIVIFDGLMMILGLESWNLWGDLDHFVYLALYLIGCDANL